MALRYEIKNRSSRNVEFVLTPFFQFVPKGADLLPDQEIVFTKGAVESEGMTLHLRTNGMIKEIAETEEVYFTAMMSVTDAGRMDTQEPTIRSVCRQRRENRWFWK